MRIGDFGRAVWAERAGLADGVVVCEGGGAADVVGNVIAVAGNPVQK